jgi:hypothetical protein
LIDTLPPSGHFKPFLHAGSYVTFESLAETPYLFAADRTLAQPYFRYRSRPQAPSEYWYIWDQPVASWDAIARDYRYIMVTVPWDPARIPLTYRVIRINTVVALLEIQREPTLSATNAVTRKFH